MWILTVPCFNAGPLGCLRLRCAESHPIVTVLQSHHHTIASFLLVGAIRDYW